MCALQVFDSVVEWSLCLCWNRVLTSLSYPVCGENFVWYLASCVCHALPHLLDRVFLLYACQARQEGGGGREGFPGPATFGFPAVVQKYEAQQNTPYFGVKQNWHIYSTVEPCVNVARRSKPSHCKVHSISIVLCEYLVTSHFLLCASGLDFKVKLWKHACTR